MNIHGTIRNKLKGEWRYDLWNEDGSLALSSDWGDNLITDFGLTNMATDSGYAEWVTLGSSPGVPQEDKSAIYSFLASENGSTDESTINGSSPYEFEETQKWRFEAGDGTGTVREMGAGTNSGGTGLFSHHSVTPEFTKLANQILDVYYRLTIFPDISDVAGSGVIGAETYNTIIRGMFYGGGVGQDALRQMTRNGSTIFRAYNGDLGAITSTPQGSQSSNPNGIIDLGTGAIANGGYREIQIQFSVDQGNVSGGVRCVSFGMVNGQWGQCQFGADGLGTLNPDDPIPKTDTDEMTLNFRYEWTRQ